METVEEANARLIRQLVEFTKKNKLLEYDIEQLNARILKDQETIAFYAKEVKLLRGKLKNNQKHARKVFVTDSDKDQ